MAHHEPTGEPSRRRQAQAWTAVVVGVLTAATMVGVLVWRAGDGTPDRPAAARPPAATTTRPAPPLPVAPIKALRTAPERLLHLRPVDVQIPDLGISSPLVDLGLNADGTLQTPADYGTAGWYSGGPYPGDVGGPPAVIAGHVDSYRGPAVFYRLRQLQPGAHVLVGRTDGSIATYTVYRTEQYPKAGFPAAVVYAPSGRGELRLITCTGAFDRSRRRYLDNYVVYATLDLAASDGPR